MAQNGVFGYLKDTGGPQALLLSIVIFFCELLMLIHSHIPFHEIYFIVEEDITKDEHLDTEFMWHLKVLSEVY